MMRRVAGWALATAMAGVTAWWPLRAVAPVPPTRAVTNSIGMRLVPVPAGKFVMGMPETEEVLYGNEAEHVVVITRAFHLGAYEVTQGEYERVTGRNPSDFSPAGRMRAAVAGMDTRRFPVEGVEWAEAVEFCKRLSAMPGEAKAGRTYRLPTEAEWEYACRAGRTTRFAFGDELTLDRANFDGRFLNRGPEPPKRLGRTCAVGSYRPNAWGLYDMHGNVWEWCADWYQPDYYARSPRQDPPGPAEGSEGRRVRRGGDFSFFGLHARSGARFPYQADRHGTGLRVACATPSR
ncbi:MAG TPA: formylglycine-generating enzyme family protein [Gemmataceae bacterium]|nr:formylglycine-generating enzyme family protein [Gemmataceae bacterium]